MPVFDYRCQDCSRTYDVFHKGKEIVDDVVCPSCGSPKHKKLMSVPMVSVGSAGADDSGGGSCETGGCCGGACSVN
ncbi:MAG: zinc ribbon domain-containing protein [Ignavibacteriales bacterium]|nr:zinc ribbon domain-containing protein [Ignavibacteriales bacterium]